MERFPPIEDLVPHAPPMLALDRLVEWSDGRAVTTMSVPDRGPFARDGRVDASWTLEFMAQTVAACLGVEAFRSGVGVRVGMVIACRALEVKRPELGVGARLRIEVTREHGTDEASRFRGEVREEGEEGEVVATAVMTLVHPEVGAE
ncbi:MAG: hypothetical protein ACF8XB_25505 [Planctomycetota bacterium JB042]